MAQNNKGFKLYALVSQYIFSILVITIGFYLLGKFVVFKTDLAGGIMACIGAIIGIILFIYQLIEIGKTNESK